MAKSGVTASNDYLIFSKIAQAQIPTLLRLSSKSSRAAAISAKGQEKLNERVIKTTFKTFDRSKRLANTLNLPLQQHPIKVSYNYRC
jgi:hypothetical protein